MKLAAIYNVWDDWDLLTHSIENIFQLVDGIIVVYSRKSNYGEQSDPPNGLYFPSNCELFQREPSGNPMEAETDKRNFGLGIAKRQGYTHFIMMDADEMYIPKEFYQEKQRFIDSPNLQGLVCATQVYFRSPKLTIGLDRTLVPFIHKLTPTISHGMNRNYPYAWDPGIRIDPTRQLNINSGVEWSNIIMHHYSWIRKDYGLKIRNSTARRNIERSTILQDLLDAKEGGFCNFYQKPLVRAQVDFGIPDYELSDKDLQLMAPTSKAP